MSLTDRQTQILKVIIEEYIATAQPVGSVTLEKKYHLGVSPATIRNEMTVLTKAGFLQQPHTSAGRTPTPMALKYYVRELLKEEELSVAEEVAVKERIWDHRFDVERFLREITKALAEKTKSLAVACTQKGNLYHAGYSYILDCPEFYDIDVTRAVLSMIDEFNQVNALFSKVVSNEPIHVLVGDDLDNEFFRDVGMVFTNFSAGEDLSGSLGIIGPCRLDYPHVIPTIRYFGELISEIAKNW
jgi:heat-inducible transcriptional repressor